MTQGFNGGSVIELLLGWFRELFNGLFELITGSSGGGLLKWLSGSWKGLLVTLIIISCALNIIIHIIRWRPHWWLFAKKRMLVDDSIFEPRSRKTGSRKKPSTIVPKRTTEKNGSDLFDTGAAASKKRSRSSR